MHSTHSVALKAGVLTWIYETHVKVFMLYMPKHYIISLCIDNWKTINLRDGLSLDIVFNVILSNMA